MSHSPVVVRIKRCKGKIVQDCDIYIGRKCFMGGWKLEESKWHNPFKLDLDDENRRKCLLKYETYIRGNSELMNCLYELSGKKLGCWCHPKPCHGDVLIKLYNEKYNIKTLL